MTVALVIGGAGCVWDDLQSAAAFAPFDGAVACNHFGIGWPGRLDAWVTLHPERMGLWVAARARLELPRHARIIGHVNGRDSFPRLPHCLSGFTDHAFPGQRASGSSGLFALKVALIDLGFDRAVLCGVPLSPEHSHFWTPREYAEAPTFHRGWVEALPAIRDRARSMSGWTADLLGRPSPGFIAGTEDSGPEPRAR